MADCTQLRDDATGAVVELSHGIRGHRQEVPLSRARGTWWLVFYCTVASPRNRKDPTPPCREGYFCR